MDEEKDGVAGRADNGPQDSVTEGGGPTWAAELLDHLRPTGRDVRRVVDWLADAVRGAATLRDEEGTLLAGPRMPLDDDVVADIVSGRISSAALEDRGRHVRLVGIRHSH